MQSGERFICADCECGGLAFKGTHTEKHTLVRVHQKAEESNISTEEELKGQIAFVQEEFSKMRQLLLKSFEKGAEGSPSDPLTKGDILDAVLAKPTLVEFPFPKGEDFLGGEHQVDAVQCEVDQDSESQEGSDDEE
jgi:hypothetical protein